MTYATRRSMIISESIPQPSGQFSFPRFPTDHLVYSEHGGLALNTQPTGGQSVSAGTYQTLWSLTVFTLGENSFPPSSNPKAHQHSTKLVSFTKQLGNLWTSIKRKTVNCILYPSLALFSYFLSLFFLALPHFCCCCRDQRYNWWDTRLRRPRKNQDKTDTPHWEYRHSLLHRHIHHFPTESYIARLCLHSETKRKACTWF